MFGKSRNGQVGITLLALVALAMFLHYWSQNRQANQAGRDRAQGNSKVAGGTGSAMPLYITPFEEPKFDNTADSPKSSEPALDALLLQANAKVDSNKTGLLFHPLDERETRTGYFFLSRYASSSGEGCVALSSQDDEWLPPELRSIRSLEFQTSKGTRVMMSGPPPDYHAWSIIEPR